MNRYFIHLAYNGTSYSGWQIQPNAISIQQVIQEALSTILRKSIDIVGCGRTDTGVHASMYYAHFDFEGDFPKSFLDRINKYLPKDIVIYSFDKVAPDAHTRFDAYHRSYEYHIVRKKNPFLTHLAWHFPFYDQIDFEKLQAAAQLLLAYDEFFPFCKTNSDAKTMRCEIKRAEWIKYNDEEKLVFHISANRFLRGMVRLIVGMCINVSIGKVDLEEVRNALNQQIRLQKSLSVPAHGLYLSDIKFK